MWPGTLTAKGKASIRMLVVKGNLRKKALLQKETGDLDTWSMEKVEILRVFYLCLHWQMFQPTIQVTEGKRQGLGN